MSGFLMWNGSLIGKQEEDFLYLLKIHRCIKGNVGSKEEQMNKILCLTLRLQFAGLYQLQPLSELKRETVMLPCL